MYEATAQDIANKIITEGNYNAAVALMDDEIRERLHAEIAPCSNFKFLTAYIIAHYNKYGEMFTV